MPEWRGLNPGEEDLESAGSLGSPVTPETPKSDALVQQRQVAAPQLMQEPAPQLSVQSAVPPQSRVIPPATARNSLLFRAPRVSRLSFRAWGFREVESFFMKFHTFLERAA